MADRVGRAVFEIATDDAEMRRGIAQTEKAVQGLGNNLKSIASNINVAAFTAFAQKAGQAIAAVAEGLVELTKRGAEVDGVQSAFDNLAGSIGSTRDAMLDAARGATKGLISDFDLMAAGNKALLLGLPVTSQSLGTMGEAAVVLGRAMKQDATKSFDDLITALGRGSPMILDNLGLSVKVSEANETYARSLGKSADSLTDAEKKMAFYNAAMAAAKAKVEEIGGIQLTLADMVTIASTKFQNFTDELGVGINRSPVLRAGLMSIGSALSDAFGGNQSALVSTLVKGLESFAIFLIDVAKVAVEFGRGVGYAFNGLKVIFNLAMGDMAAKLSMVAGLLATMAEKASGLPGVGSTMQSIASSMRNVSVMAGGAATGFAQTADAALDSAAAVGDGADKIQGVLTTMQNSMIAAQAKAGEMATGVSDSMRRTGDAAQTEGTRTAVHVDAIAARFQELRDEIALNTKVGIDRRLAELDAGRNKEIAGLSTLKDLSAAKYEELKLLIDEKYRGMAEAARMGTDEIKAKHQQLQQDITLAETFGQQQRLMQLEFSRQKEIESIAYLKANYVTQYDELVLLINEKYNQLTLAAQGHYASVEQAAAAAGFKTRAEQEQTAARAQALYEQMVASGKFSYEELQRAHKAWKDAEAALDDSSLKAKAAGFVDLAGSVSSVLRDIFGKSKTAAIAAAIIDTAAAVVKTMAAYPFPFNIAPALAAAAAGYKQVQIIKDTKFKKGTPGLDFMDFGRESTAFLHNQEAVIPRGSGHMLAAEIAAAMPGPDSAMAGTLEAIRAGIEGLPRAISRGYRNAAAQAGV